jgi:hypothetical protein
MSVSTHVVCLRCTAIICKQRLELWWLRRRMADRQAVVCVASVCDAPRLISSPAAVARLEMHSIADLRHSIWHHVPFGQAFVWMQEKVRHLLSSTRPSSGSSATRATCIHHTFISMVARVLLVCDADAQYTAMSALPEQAGLCAHQLHDRCDDEGVLKAHGGDQHPACERLLQLVSTSKHAGSFMATFTSAAHWCSVLSAGETYAPAGCC